MTTPTPQPLPELPDAIAWLQSEDVVAGPRTHKAIKVVLAALAARPSAVPAGPDWRELTRRLYVELFHCNRQMTTERRKWTAGPCVLNALADAKAALEANPATPAQAVESETALTMEDAFTLLGHAEVIGGTDMPDYFRGLAARIARSIGDEAGAKRCEELRAARTAAPGREGAV